MSALAFFGGALLGIVLTGACMPRRAPAAATATDRSREAFETTLRGLLEEGESVSFKRNKCGVYVATFVARAWALWQACAGPGVPS